MRVENVFDAVAALNFALTADFASFRPVLDEAELAGSVTDRAAGVVPGIGLVGTLPISFRHMYFSMSDSRDPVAARHDASKVHPLASRD